MAYFLLLFISCLITFEGGEDRTAVIFEQAETSKAISCRTPLQSSGKILIMNKGTMLGHGSGNYFKSGQHKFILTAAHVINHPYEAFILDGEELVSLVPIHVDPIRDLAILLPEKELSVIKIKSFRVNRSNDLTGKTIYYAGFPQDLGKSLFRGFISKDSDYKLLVQSFALPGSSGSVVFDFWGRAIGVLSAVSVGMSSVNPFPELLETAVHVQKIQDYDHKLIDEAVSRHKENMKK
jgi:S1-C subfamily serine protease